MVVHAFKPSTLEAERQVDLLRSTKVSSRKAKAIIQRNSVLKDKLQNETNKTKTEKKKKEKMKNLLTLQ